MVIDPAFHRPADVAVLLGDASKAKAILGWQPQVTFPQLVNRMVDHDARRHGISAKAATLRLAS